MKRPLVDTRHECRRAGAELGEGRHCIRDRVAAGINPEPPGLSMDPAVLGDEAVDSVAVHGGKELVVVPVMAARVRRTEFSQELVLDHGWCVKSRIAVADEGSKSPALRVGIVLDLVGHRRMDEKLMVTRCSAGQLEACISGCLDITLPGGLAADQHIGVDQESQTPPPSIGARRATLRGTMPRSGTVECRHLAIPRLSIAIRWAALRRTPAARVSTGSRVSSGAWVMSSRPVSTAR